MRPVRQTLAALALLALAAALTGCDTTRDKNLRAEISANRSLATREKVVVKKPFAPIEVEAVQAVGKGKDSLIVVRIANSSDQAWAALPINVKAGGKVINRGPDIPYFYNHIPAVGAKSSTVWVLDPGKRIPSGRLTAVVGAPDSALSKGKTLPDLRATGIDVSDGGILGRVENHSGVPQYWVGVYVTTSSKGRYTSAARGYVFRVTGSGSKPFKVFPVGKPGKSEPQVTLAPGILVPTSSD